MAGEEEGAAQAEVPGDLSAKSGEGARHVGAMHEVMLFAEVPLRPRAAALVGACASGGVSRSVR